MRKDSLLLFRTNRCVTRFRIGRRNCYVAVNDAPNYRCTVNQDSGGSGFDDYGGELELHKLDFSQENAGAGTLLGKVKTRRVCVLVGQLFALSCAESGFCRGWTSR